MSTAVTDTDSLACLTSDEETKIRELREILKNIHIDVPEECDGFLLCCLRVKSHDVSKATKIVQGVQKTITAFDEYFDLYDSHLSELAFNQGIINVLKNRDEYGRQIFLLRYGRWHPKEITCEQVTLILLFMYVWIVGKFAETQTKGVVAILDLTNFGWEQFREAKIWIIVQVFKLMQDSNPGKIKGIHIIYNPRLFQTIFKLVKPFVKEKLYKRVHFHNQDAASLHMFLKPEILPVSLGGKLTEEGALDMDLLGGFLDDKMFIAETRRLGLPKI